MCHKLRCYALAHLIPSHVTNANTTFTVISPNRTPNSTPIDPILLHTQISYDAEFTVIPFRSKLTTTTTYLLTYSTPKKHGCRKVY